MGRKKLDIIFGICVVLVIFWFVWEAAPWSFHSRLFPWTIGVSVLLLALVQVGTSLRNVEFRALESDADSKVNFQDSQTTEVDKSTAWRIITICSWIAFFFAGIWLFGFRVGSLILTVCFLRFAGGEEYKKCLGLGLINYLFFLVIFDLALGVPLLEGALAQWLDIEALDRFIGKKLILLWG